VDNVGDRGRELVPGSEVQGGYVDSVNGDDGSGGVRDDSENVSSSSGGERRGDEIAGPCVGRGDLLDKDVASVDSNRDVRASSSSEDGDWLVR